MTDRLTPTMKKALCALLDHGGHGLITKTGTLLAAGEELHNGDPVHGRYAAVTWLRLFAEGLLEAQPGARVSISEQGHAVAVKL